MDLTNPPNTNRSNRFKVGDTVYAGLSSTTIKRKPGTIGKIIEVDNAARGCTRYNIKWIDYGITVWWFDTGDWVVPNKLVSKEDLINTYEI